ncbi:MAG: tetratricopeptide repeat protein [Bdellovibrionota bacterium]
MRILLTTLIISAVFGSQVVQADTRGNIINAYKQLRSSKKVAGRNKLRLQIAEGLQDLQFPEASLLYVYPVLTSKDTSNLATSVPLLDRAISKSGESNLYRLVPASLKSSLDSPSYKEFLIHQQVKEMIAANNVSGAEDLVRKNEGLPLLASRYAVATGYMLAKNPKASRRLFQEIAEYRTKAPIDDRQRGLALLGVARAFYQEKDLNSAATTYREFPKDHPYFRRSMLELSWALFRAGQFRSALSPLHSLHSDFYEGFFQPESLYLRAMIQLFTCRYDEAASTLAVFDRTYRNAYFQMRKWLDEPPSSKKNLEEVFLVSEAASKKISDRIDFKVLKLPYLVVRTAVDEPITDVLLRRQRTLLKERKRLDVLFKGFPPLRKQLTTFLDKRMQRNQARILDQLGASVIGYAQETEAWFTLMDLIRLEIIEGQKNIARGKMYLPKDQPQTITETLTRKYFIQNGYRFWPFQGEYWRDELGNYQFVGNNVCTAQEMESE